MIILFFVTIYLFSVVPAFSSWQTEREAEIRSEEEKFETIFSDPTLYQKQTWQRTLEGL